MDDFHSCLLRKGRYSEPGRPYLITTATSDRAPLFRDPNAGRLVEREIRALDRKGQVESLCWVIMPDHLHWLFILSRGELYRAVQEMKSRSAIAINRYLGTPGHVWQQGFHDRALRRDEDVRKVARYIIANPLRAGLVEDVLNYPLWDAVWFERNDGLEI